jgi:hypothetical protein
MMGQFRRSLLTLCLAALVPIIAFVALQVILLMREERREIEAMTLGRAREVINLIDAELKGNIAAMQVLANSMLLENDRLADFHARSMRSLKINPSWVTIKLCDASDGKELLDLRRAFGTPSSFVLDPDIRRALAETKAPIVGGIDKEAPNEKPYAWIHVPVMREQDLSSVISLAVDPRVS